MSVIAAPSPEVAPELDRLTIDELFELSDRSFRQRDHATSRRALMRAVEVGEKLHITYHKLARLDFAAGDLTTCIEHLDLGRAAEPDFPYNWMWSARAHHMLEQMDTAIEHAERFVRFGVAPYNATELALLEALASHVFTRGQRSRSLPFYEFLVAQNPAKPLLRLRLAESMSAAGQYRPALDILEALDAEGALDLWGRRAMAETRALAGDRDGALAVMTALVEETDGDPVLLDLYIHLLRHATPATVRAALAANGGRLPAALRTELQTRLDVAEGRIDQAADMLLALEEPLPKQYFHLAFEVAYAALSQAKAKLAERLGARLRAVAPDDVHVKLLAINVLFAEQEWEQAGLLLDSLSPEEARQPHALLKRFELACFQRDTARAAQMLRDLEDLPAQSKDFHLPIFRYLAERGAWDELVDRAVLWLDRSFRYASIGSVVFRAVKRTRRHAEMIGAIELVEGWADQPDLKRLRAALALDAAQGAEALDRIAADPTVVEHAALRRRLAIQRAVWARALGRDRRRGFFLCTNRGYLCASLVALHSALPYTDHAVTDHFIVVDDDLLEATEQYLGAYRDAGISVRAVPAQRILEGTEKLDAGYGLFTSGHTLSESAYYRIFFARHLQAAGDYDRAVYVDSDVLVRGSLEPLFEADLGGAPLSARIEGMRPEVRRAIRANAIKDDAYFNSGVLLFDLQSETVTAGLDRTIHAIADEETTLLFQDQCALNIGFNGRFRPMDRRWNQPVNEDTSLDEIPPEAVILHFLDRPKPWNADYTGEAAALWFEQWRSMAGRIGEHAAIELLRTANA